MPNLLRLASPLLRTFSSQARKANPRANPEELRRQMAQVNTAFQHAIAAIEGSNHGNRDLQLNLLRMQLHNACNSVKAMQPEPKAYEYDGPHNNT